MIAKFNRTGFPRSLMYLDDIESLKVRLSSVEFTFYTKNRGIEPPYMVVAENLSDSEIGEMSCLLELSGDFMITAVDDISDVLAEDPRRFHILYRKISEDYLRDREI